MNQPLLDLIIAEARRFYKEHPEELEKARKESQNQQSKTN